MGAWRVWGFVVLGAWVWLALIACAPLVRAWGYESAAQILYAVFAPVCHQQPGRSLSLDGEPLGVCARCFGIYAGFAASAALLPLARVWSGRSAFTLATPWRGWLILGALPTAFDWALSVFGIWPNTHWSRGVTGALFGVVIACYVVPGALDLSRCAWRSWWGMGDGRGGIAPSP